jgi:uroporphyrinogen-III synthase
VRLLVTRPDPTRTAQALRARGHTVVVAPLMRIETIEAAFGGPFAAVLLTSANAARALSAHPRRAALTRLPAFAVGARSAEAAREAGFAAVESADGALCDLVALVARRFAGQRLIYLAGADRSGDLAGDLAPHGVAVETAVVYRAAAVAALPEQAARALAAGEVDAVLHYSARSAATLLQLAGSAGVLNTVISLAHYCLSAEVAAPLREAGAGQVRAAMVPTEAGLMALLSEST